MYPTLSATVTLCLISVSSSVFVNHSIVVFSFRFVYSQYAVEELNGDEKVIKWRDGLTGESKASKVTQ